MAEFRILDHLDAALLKAETGEPYASKTPAVWPSEASAQRLDRSQWDVVGKCHLSSFYRMLGMSVTNPPNALNVWKWVLGRSVEEHLTDQAKASGVYVAEGVKHWIPDLMMAIEMDVISMDPATGDPYIVECKSFSGYYATKEIITAGKPKLENLMQIAQYHLEVRTGARLKQIIRQSLEDRKALDAKQAALATKGQVWSHRNRCQANLDALEQMTDGPVKGKLVYVDRGEAVRKEFTIEIFEEEGYHYPLVDGVPFKVFTLESIFTRYKTLQTYWFQARAEAVRRLAQQGITPPEGMPLVMDPRDVSASPEPRSISPTQRVAEASYLKQLEQMMRDLPPQQFYPKPEYEWSYSPERIDQLYAAKLISKAKYTAYTKDKVQRLGDWNCEYCQYLGHCLKIQQPTLQYHVDDVMAWMTDESVEVEIG